MTRDSEWAFHVDRSPQSRLIKFYLIRYSAGRDWVAVFDDSDPGYGDPTFRMEELEEGVEPKPLFVVGRMDEAEGLLLAMAEGLKKAGVEIEVDVSKRVAAQAVADERGKELDYFKELNAMLIKDFVKGDGKDALQN